MRALISALAMGLPALSLAATGCGRCSSDGSAEPSPSASAAASVAPAPSAAAAARGAPVPRDVPMPSGPVLAILAGQGLGPVRFGATLATVERLMQQPCDVRTEKLCRYVARAVEFFFDADGQVERIVVHRPGRATVDAAGKPNVYGMFHGAIPPDLKMLMLPWAVQQHLGKPMRVETVTNAGSAFTEERHHYPNMTLEYDRLQNGNLVLGGVLLEKPQP